MSERELEGKMALVTGATGGIGPSICHELAEAGAAILVHGHTQLQAADALVRELDSCGVAAHAVCSDLTEP